MSRMAKAWAPLHGVLVVDKPGGMTSFDVVKRVRRWLKVKKVGHTGTLDPMATGVLPLCLGEATKIAGLLQADDKAYLAGVLLGVQTDTLDMDGQVLAEGDASNVSRAQVGVVLETLRGDQQQVPPVFSAIHTNGQRAYELARKGQQVDLPPRAVQIHTLELCSWSPPRLELQVDCSKGTYVRSLVRDLGLALGCGAALESLRRQRSGAFDLEQAVPLDQVRTRLADQTLPLVSMDHALAHLPLVEIDQAQARRLRQGQPLDVQMPPGELLRVRHDGQLVAPGQPRADRLWPRRVFNKTT